MISTIQIHENVKKALKRFGETGKESYEEIIMKMIDRLEKQMREKEKLMIEGCKEMAEDSLRITKEWEATDAQLDWEWKEDGN